MRAIGFAEVLICLLPLFVSFLEMLMGVELSSKAINFGQQGK